ncbi:MAG: twin-arginine translocation signal domain-containing protein [Lentisphaerae bacterium]|nr:twin-arginine translocation signal domain-containing protein [Lentisphaerota bacterium]
MKEQNRREFIKMATFAGGAAALGGCASPISGAPVIAGDKAFGVLLHLGVNMWGDWTPDQSKIPASAEALAKMYPDDKLDDHGLMPHRVYGFSRVDDAVWRESTGLMKSEGLNLVMIDLGEAYAYPSHPELWVKGSWSPEKLSAELARLRSMGLEPVPKLNFSTGHDQWLKEYHYMTSTKRYYEVVADVIRDTVEVFGNPRYFHIGFDEEIPIAHKDRQLMVIRQGDLWWHDLFYVISLVEKHGSRAMMWSDKMCGGREEFFKRMTKNVLQIPWYYGDDFSEKNLRWRSELEKKLDSWESQDNLAASIMELNKAGFEMMPCTSNWAKDTASDAMLSFVSKRLDPSLVKGVLTAPWAMSYKEEWPMMKRGIRQFADAKRRYFPKKG